MTIDWLQSTVCYMNIAAGNTLDGLQTPTTIDVKRTTSACGKGVFYSMTSEKARLWADDSGMGYCIVCLDGDLVNTDDGEAGRIDGGQAELERAMSEYGLVVEG